MGVGLVGEKQLLHREQYKPIKTLVFHQKESNFKLKPAINRQSFYQNLSFSKGHGVNKGNLLLHIQQYKLIEVLMFVKKNQTLKVQVRFKDKVSNFIKYINPGETLEHELFKS